MFVNRVPSLKIKMFILEPWVDLKYSPTLVTSSRTRTRRNPENLRRWEILLSTDDEWEKERKEEYIPSVCQVYKRRNLKNVFGTYKEKNPQNWTSKFRRKEIGVCERNSKFFGRWPVECFKTTSDSNLLQVLPKGKAGRYSGTGKRDSRFINGGRNCPSAKLKKLINSVVT